MVYVTNIKLLCLKFLPDKLNRRFIINNVQFKILTGVVPRGEPGGRGGRGPSEISGLPYALPPKKKVQDKAVTCHNFLLKPKVIKLAVH